MSYSKSVAKQRGDTLVEVTIAMAVLGLILASTMTIINRSLLNVMNAVQRTAVRGYVNSQVELLSYVYNSRNSAVNEIRKDITNQVNGAKPGAANQIGQSRCKAVTGKSFSLDWQVSGDKNTISLGPGVSSGNQDQPYKDFDDANLATPTAGKGIWIEGIKHDGGSSGVPGYIDFYVRACWTPYASTQPGLGMIESTLRVTLGE